MTPGNTAVSLGGITVTYDDFCLDDVSLDIETGEFFVIMGPTGAGKTVLLEAVLGIAPLTAGSVVVAGRNVTRLPPERRGIGIVYQDYALFPHLRVEANVRFGLRYGSNRGSNGEAAHLEHLYDVLDLRTLLHRRVDTLSGGESQRVALARALATQPSIVLLDEPLSALDPRFREEIRRTLRRIHHETGTTFIMVSHDFRDALSLGDRAAVIHQGRLQQVGAVDEIFRRPATRFVAEFVGMENILEAKLLADGSARTDGGLTLQLGGGPTGGGPTGRGPSGGSSAGAVDAPAVGAVPAIGAGSAASEAAVPSPATDGVPSAAPFPAAEGLPPRVRLAIRPEDIVLSRTPLDSSMRNGFPARVLAVQDHGPAYAVRCAVATDAGGAVGAGRPLQPAPTELVAYVTRGSLLELGIEEGLRLHLSFKATAVHVF